ncbi:MAG: hypothetical protein NT094_00685, partial [Candidatus Staskawiczbacteria bacterium]|nr:hypothetical protein [Candidatus Staskawiczbacteria bacterium]
DVCSSDLYLVLIIAIAGVLGRALFMRMYSPAQITEVTSESQLLPTTLNEQKLLDESKARIADKPKAFPMDPPKVDALSDWGWLYSGDEYRYVEVVGQGRAIQHISGAITFLPVDTGLCKPVRIGSECNSIFPLMIVIAVVVLVIIVRNRKK